ncbi:hypothetical protein [Kitasatospora mediocidica]|uniref:hypothetical protein n=1 Tax=Kitasatospora mediocidica TaxID=58352 RepID=UPI0005640B47|nr:hypothetical protein [Kitasatospora mediocidica]
MADQVPDTATLSAIATAAEKMQEESQSIQQTWGPVIQAGLLEALIAEDPAVKASFNAAAKRWKDAYVLLSQFRKPNYAVYWAQVPAAEAAYQDATELSTILENIE